MWSLCLTADKVRKIVKLPADTATIADLYQQAHEAWPDAASISLLQAGVPPRPLPASSTDTLSQAGLQNQDRIIVTLQQQQQQQNTGKNSRKKGKTTTTTKKKASPLPAKKQSVTKESSNNSKRKRRRKNNNKEEEEEEEDASSDAERETNDYNGTTTTTTSSPAPSRPTRSKRQAAQRATDSFAVTMAAQDALAKVEAQSKKKKAAASPKTSSSSSSSSPSSRRQSQSTTTNKSPRQFTQSVGRRLQDGATVAPKGRRQRQTTGTAASSTEASQDPSLALLSTLESKTKAGTLLRQGYKKAVENAYEQNRAVARLAAIPHGVTLERQGIDNNDDDTNATTGTLHVTFTKGVQGRGEYTEEVDYLPLDVLQQVVGAIYPVNAEALRPENLALLSPRVLWSLLYHFPQSATVRDALQAVQPTLDWSVLQRRKQTLSAKAQENLRQAQEQAAAASSAAAPTDDWEAAAAAIASVEQAMDNLQTMDRHDRRTRALQAAEQRSTWNIVTPDETDEEEIQACLDQGPIWETLSSSSSSSSCTKETLCRQLVEDCQIHNWRQLANANVDEVMAQLGLVGQESSARSHVQAWIEYAQQETLDEIMVEICDGRIDVVQALAECAKSATPKDLANWQWLVSELRQELLAHGTWNESESSSSFCCPSESQLETCQNLAAGGDVFDRLSQRKTYSEQDARVLARVLLEAMDAMHHVQPSAVVHRDLKPENLLLADAENDASILLADFGFARHVTPEGCKTRCGTPAFVAPEVVLGIPYGVSVDLWSIGCLLYMLIGGYPPFSGKNHRELFRKIRAADFVFHEAYFGKVSDSAKNVISHLLTVNTDFRWSARKCLESDWFKKETADHLSSTDLSDTIREIKRFKARRSWKAARVVIKWASTQPFWKPDAVSFAEQMSTWDKEMAAGPSPNSSTSNVGSGGGTPGGGSAATFASLMSHVPRLKFADVYELQSKIRKGSYAVVWKAVHRHTGEVYAVKVVTRLGLKPSDDEAVMNEVAIMQQLAGKKHYVQLMDFYEEADAFYLVMEYMSGGDVFDQVVKKTHYTEKDARDLVSILLKAVSTLHDLGIAHRDVKPQNLLLKAGEDREVKIGDFGFARRVHTPCSLTSRMGTPTYVAPEILKNIPHDDRVDLWSIGVVTFVLLVGYPPFLEDTQSALFEKIRTGEWEFVESDWRHVSKDAKEFVKGLLVVDPKERWSIKECLRCAWINKDPDNLSSIDLSMSLGTIRQRRSRLRSLAKTVIWLGRDLHSVSEVPTHAHIELT